MWRERSVSLTGVQAWWLAGWSVGALVLYWIVAFEVRYFAVFLPLLALGLLQMITRRWGTWETIISGCIAVALIAPAATGVSGEWQRIAEGKPHPADGAAFCLGGISS